jgi:hypothetical protein
MTHVLKTLPEYFKAVKEKRKTFEVRKNDRDFKVGDELILSEFNPKTSTYTGDTCGREITYILKGGQFGITEDVVILGLKPI